MTAVRDLDAGFAAAFGPGRTGRDLPRLRTGDRLLVTSSLGRPIHAVFVAAGDLPPVDYFPTDGSKEDNKFGLAASWDRVALFTPAGSAGEQREHPAHWQLFVSKSLGPLQTYNSVTVVRHTANRQGTLGIAPGGGYVQASDVRRLAEWLDDHR